MKNCWPLPLSSLLKCVLSGDIDGAACVFCLCDQSLLSPSYWLTLRTQPQDEETITVHGIVKELDMTWIAGDLKSKKICTTCIEQLSSFYVFKKKCLKAVSTMEDLVNTVYKQTTNASLKYFDEEQLFEGETLNIEITVESLKEQKTNEFECRKCYSDFPTVEELAKHQTMHGKSQYYLCRICDERFIGFQRLVTHCKSIHPDRPGPTLVMVSPTSDQKTETFTCSKCNETFSTQANLNLHISHRHVEKTESGTVQNEETFNCQDCDAKFEDKKQLWQHRYKDHNQSSKCQICNKTVQENHRCRYTCLDCTEGECVHQNYLKAFYEDRSKPNRTCIDCDFTYKDRATLLEHANRCHLLILPHVCSECGKKLPSKKALSSHRAIYHPSYTCPHCNVKFHKHVLEKHIKECKTSLKPYRCSLCEGRFTSAEQVKMHRKSHIPPSLFKCKMCSVELGSRNELKHHVIQSHGAPKESAPPEVSRAVKAFPCAKCVLDFPTKEESLAHELSHALGTDYLCPGCNKTFATKAERHECMRTHKTDLTEVCPLCGRMFTKLGLQTHLKVHASRGEVEIVKSERRVLPKVYVCDICGSKHGSSQAVKRHKERHKKQEKCSYCSKLVWPRHMRKHLSLHGPKQVQKIVLQCKECDFSSHIESVFEGHINREHRKIQPYECEVCEKRFYSKVTLTTHLTIHSGKIRKCEECGKEFRSSRGHVLHMRQHRGEMRFRCEYCDMKFVSSSRQKEHEARVHFEPQYQCSSCDMKFYRIATIKKHIKTVHYGEKARRRIKFNRKDV